ncbi:MAG: IS1634 family transposase [Dissulfurispiraceae bacterium]
MTYIQVLVIIVSTMYVDTSTINQGDKSYTRHLLRESYREGKKVRHRTIANLSQCSEEEIAAIRLALRHKKDLSALTTIGKGHSFSQQQGLSIGAVWSVYDIARQLGIVDAFGSTREGKLGMWQVIARVIDQGSRLSAVRLAGAHAACDVLGVGRFDEDDLYKNLDWLCEHQASIEERLFRTLARTGKPGLFLYDVTSSYFEGIHNELSAFGYNRDGKKGKQQIVIGLLCNEVGVPLSVEVFTGNTQDPQTFAPQIKKVAERFGSQEVTFVGDRGMIKSRQIEQLGSTPYGFHYITAITKPQIETLLKKNVIQMDLFEQALAEVKTQEGLRYVLRRNPARADEIKKSREDKLNALKKEILKHNHYLKEHRRSKVEVLLRKVNARSKQLKISDWALLSASEREITLIIDNDMLTEEAKLDGCYVLKTDLSEAAATKETIHNRYKDLTLVESAFRTSKTVELELRPIHVRLATRTRGHAFVVMVAYRIVKELSLRWQNMNLTVKEGLNELATLCATKLLVDGAVQINDIPVPRKSVKELLEAANIRLPKSLPCNGIHVTTKKKLRSSRNNT